jgi:hypothetical protein
MGGYSPEEREQLPSSDFLKPETRGWPVSDKRHAEIALQYMAWGRGNRSEYPKLLERLFAIPRYENDKGLRQLYERLKPQIEARMARKNPYYSGPDTRTEAELQAIEAQILGPAARTNPFWIALPGMGARSALHRSGTALKEDKPLASARRRVLDQEMIAEGLEEMEFETALARRRARVEEESKRLRAMYEEQRKQKLRPPASQATSPVEPVVSDYRKRRGTQVVTFDAPLSGRAPRSPSGPATMAGFELMRGGPVAEGFFRPSITVIREVELQPRRAKVRFPPLMPHEEPESPEPYTTGFAEVAEAHPHEGGSAEMQREHAEMHRKVADLVKASSQLNQAMRLGRMTAPAYLRTKSKLNEQAQALLDQKRRLDQAARYKGPRGAQGATPLAEAELRSRMMAQGSFAFPEFERSWERKDKELAEARKAQAAAQRAGLRKKVAPLPLSGIKDPELRRLYSEQMIEEEEGSPFMGGSEMFVSEEVEEPGDTDWMYHEGAEEFANENPFPDSFVGFHLMYPDVIYPMDTALTEHTLISEKTPEGEVNWQKSAKAALADIAKHQPPNYDQVFIVVKQGPFRQWFITEEALQAYASHSR